MNIKNPLIIFVFIFLSISASTYANSYMPKWLELNSLTSITDEQAREFADSDVDGLLLTGLQSITDEQARTLSTFGGDYLNLDGLTELSSAQAIALASFDGDGYFGTLSLGGLTELSDDAAKALGKCKVQRLELYGIIGMTDKQAESLGNFENYLSLDGLTSITDNQARALSRRVLDLSGLTSITPDQIRLLGSYAAPKRPRSLRLTLDGLTHLTDEQIEAILELGNCDDNGRPLIADVDGPGSQNMISLRNADSLTEPQMKRLAEFGGDIDLDMDMKRTRDFSDHKRDFWLTRWAESRDTIEATFGNYAECENCMFVRNFATLTASEARVLVNCCLPFSAGYNYLELDNLRQLEDGVAEILAAWQGNRLSFGNLESLSPENARHLAEFKGDQISIGGLAFLSDSLLCAFREFDRTLAFDSLTTLAGLSAECFSQLKASHLIFRRIQTMSDEEATNLLAPGSDYWVWLSHLRRLTDAQIDLILKSDHFVKTPSIDSLTDSQIRRIATIRYFWAWFELKNISQETEDLLLQNWREIHGTTNKDLPTWWINRRLPYPHLEYDSTALSPCK